MSTETNLRLRLAGSGEPLSVRPGRLIVAGYTARDEAAVNRHIEELAAIGVPPPASVPAFYDLDPGLVSTGARVEVAGAATSGEVEPVLVRHRGTYFLGVGSDHTDRALERTDVAASKAACPKPVGGTVTEIGPGLAALSALSGGSGSSGGSGGSGLDWDGIEAGCEVDGAAYQAGPLASLRHPAELVERMTATLGEISGDLVLFCGTLPLIGGEFIHGGTWSLSLRLPTGTHLRHTYTADRQTTHSGSH